MNQLQRTLHMKKLCSLRVTKQHPLYSSKRRGITIEKKTKTIRFHEIRVNYPDPFKLTASSF